MNQEFTFRKMMPSDKDDALRICSKIWDGHDFLLKEFDEWVKDDKGLFAAVLHEGKLVAMGKITFLTETDAWLEGLRKDQDSELKGIGLLVTQYLLDILRKRKNLSSLRFCTYFKNMGSVKSAEKCGFKLIRSFSMKEYGFEDENKPKGPSYAPVIQINDVDKILDYVHTSEFIPLSGNLLCLSWVVHPYSDELFINELIKPGNCFAIMENGEIKALAALYFKRGFHISFFDAENFSYAKSLMNHLQTLSFERQNWGLEIFVPEFPKLKSFVEDFGFKSWEAENDVVVYGRPIDW